MDNVIRLENEYLLCLFNNSGVILGLTDKKRCCSLVVPGENLTGWKMISNLGSWREHPIFDADNGAEINVEPAQAVFSFKGLHGARGDRLNFHVTMTYALCGAELTAKIEVDNQSDEVLREIWFPFLSGIRELDKHENHYLVLNYSTGMIMDDPLANLPQYDGTIFGNRPGGRFFSCHWKQYPFLYPGVCSMPWMDYYNGKQGWYLGYHDEKTPSTALLMRTRGIEGDMQLGFARYPFIKPGQKWSSGSFVIHCHGGGWREGARRYAAFAKTKLNNLAAPAWLQNAPGFHIVGCIGQDRRINNTYDHIYDTFKANLEEGLNLPILVFGWVRRGFDNGYPELEADERIGGADKLREVIAKVRGEGGKVMLYTQGRLIDLCTDFYKTIGKDCCLVSEDGVPYIDEYSFNSEATTYPNRLFALSCPSTRQWQTQMKKQIDIVMDLGADGILFDQIGADNAFICFNESHGHGSPDTAFHGKVAMLEELQRYAAEKSPDFAIIGELICDVFLQKLDITHGLATQENGTETLDIPEGVRILSEIYRYTHPRHRPSSRLCQTRNDYSRAFVNGLVLEHNRQRGTDLHTYVVQLQGLRASLMDFFNNSVFADEDGISYQPADFTVKHYVGDDGRHGIGMANLTGKQATVCVSAPALKGDAVLLLPGGERRTVSISEGAFQVTLNGGTAAFLLA